MNQTEAKIIELQIRAKVVEVEVAAMAANDRNAEMLGAGVYMEESYLRKAARLKELADQIELYSRGMSK